MKVKLLIARFGFNTLAKECANHGWVLPCIKDLKNMDIDIPYEDIWVADIPDKEEDHASHSLIYRKSIDKLLLVNKNIKEHAIVLEKGG